MTIEGIGTDIIEIERIKHAILRHAPHFLNRVFTLAEQSYCLQFRESHRHFSGRFAAKEAIVKALGTGFRGGISWLDIEIMNNSAGAPQVMFFGALKSLVEQKNLQVMVTISHCKEYATAFAICQSERD